MLALLPPLLRRCAAAARPLLSIALALIVALAPGPVGAAPLPVSAPAACDPAWLPIPGVDTHSAGVHLYGLAARAPDDVWAVGDSGNSEQTAALHWDGHTLAVVPSPNVNPPDQLIENTLVSVAIVAPGDVWAVGRRGTIVPNPGGGRHVGPDQALAEHWDGHTWAIVPLSRLAPDQASSLAAVAAAGPQAVWAVGQGNGGALVLHWDGATWQPVPFPPAPFTHADLTNLAVTAPADVWVLGSANGGAGPQGPFVGHWDGAQWTVTPLTAAQFGLRAPHGNLLLAGLAASGPGDIWVAGTFLSTGEAPNPKAPPPLLAEQTVLLHWDGHAWSRVPSPNPGRIGGDLYAVAAAGPRDAWAVGSYFDDSQASLVLHWDGSTWTQVASPNPDTVNDILSSVAIAGPDEIWAAGWPLLAHYGRPCVPAPPPTAPVPDPRTPGVVYLPAVQHTLRGRFLAYWQAHGGLAQFGYPLTEEFSEVSPTDGHSYTVQYFERNRFEFHPEYAGTPAEVLLGLLGRAVTVDRTAEPPFRPLPAAPPGATYFPATRHTLAPAFAAYWATHGGLAVYGYPISEPFTEVSPTDGRSYTVQYFERNRLESHPELPAAYRVSLGLLGVQILHTP